MKREIAHLLFKVKEVVVLDTKNYIEIQPGIWVPMVVNIKATLRYFNVRRRLAEELAKKVNPKSTCICGIESGGNYYATAVSDILRKPLIFFRKEPKGYGIGDRFVGFLPKGKNELITIIDDVIARGMISATNNEMLKEQGYCSELITVFSFSPKLVGPMSKVKTSSLTDINTLCKIGLELGVFNKKDVKIIKEEYI